MLAVESTADARNNAELPLLKNRKYIFLLCSQIVSNLGDWLTMLAILTLIGLKWQATPWEITGATLCMLLPMLFGGPLAGLLADRVERKKIMIFSDVARIFLVSGFIFVHDIWQLYILLVAKSAFDVMFGPAKNGKIKEIVPTDQLEQAVSYSAIIEQGSKIVGPALGGLLTAAFGVSACFLVNGFTFLLSALFLFRVPGRSLTLAAMAGDAANLVQSQPSSGEAASEITGSGTTEDGRAGSGTTESETEPVGNRKAGGFGRELAAGIRMIVMMPVIAYGLLMLAMVLLVLQIADSQTVVLFREIKDLPPNLLGWCIALSGVGTFTAVGLVRVLKTWTPLGKMGFGAFLMGGLFVAAGLLAKYGSFNGGWILLMLLCFLLVGLGAGMTFIPYQVELQKRTPERMTGRVFGTVNSILSAASLIGPIVGGYLVTAFGAVTAFEISGTLVALIGIVLLFYKTVIMKKDRIAHERMEGEKAAGRVASSSL